MSSNRVVEVLQQVSDLLRSLPLDAHAGLEPGAQVAAARLIQQGEAQLNAHAMANARAIAASDTARSHGATSTGSLLAKTFGGDRRAGDRLVHRAQQMAQVPATERALRDGMISAGQADLIASTLAGLPHDLTAADRQACEDTLIAAAPSLSINDLRRRADRIAEVYAPDEVDKAENDTLQQREQRAWANTQFWMNDQHDGTHVGGFRLPDLIAEQLQKMVDVLAAPRNANSSPDDAVLLDTRPSAAQRNGYAFAELISRYPTDVLPGSKDTDGAQLLVNIDYDTLVGAIVPATLETGTRISAQEALRLACDAGIMPAVFDGRALPTHLGRSARLFSRQQRRALAQRDRGCAFPGCDRPPGWCEAHHAGDPWCAGGQTNLDQGVLLCAFHHRLIHNSDWDVRIVDQIPEFLPPAALDPQRRARRNDRYAAGRPAA